tara:strand:- start:361 stop:1152 length:792 start_codon:yes stop_codon:yes gene_type:complete
MLKIFNLYILLILNTFFNFAIAHADNFISCSICENQIKDKEYYVDAWGNPFHIYHKKTGTFCECCSRIISHRITNGGYKLNDGRYICSLCDASIIETEQEIENSLKKVIGILKTNGIVNLNKKEIKIELINKIEMSDNYRFHEVQHLKGLTKIKHEDEKMFQIYILDNLPKIQFEAALAHELLHIWLFKKNITLDKPLMEGFCNLGSYLIYNLDNTKFSKILLLSLENTETNTDAYKYKILKNMMEKNSFKYIIDNIQTIDIK